MTIAPANAAWSLDDCIREPLPGESTGQWERALSLATRAADEGCAACGTLAVLCAFAALESVLNDMRDAGRIPTKGHTLRKMMVASMRAGVVWLDYPRLRNTVVRRNAAAHGRLLLEPREVRDYVACIGAQLKAWGV